MTQKQLNMVSRNFQQYAEKEMAFALFSPSANKYFTHYGRIAGREGDENFIIHWCGKRVLVHYTRIYLRESYQQKKAQARQNAIDWQNLCGNSADLSYGELSEAGDTFYKLGKRYGLLREFRTNGIPC